ncbi:ATP-grasp domain-containing protein [Ancrocorticia populi]|nr:ATP-grasp domain-containing protein [Ancrocorticia populi]
MKVLILSAGKRVKIIEYLRQAGVETIIAADCSELAPALYVADSFYIVPRSTTPEYAPAVRDICKRESVDLCIPTLDLDLDPLAEYREEFASFGTTLMISPAPSIDLAADKWKMYEFCLAHNIPTPRTWIDRDVLDRDLASGEARFPLFSKPVRSAGSVDIGIARDSRDLDNIFASSQRMLVQEFMDGEPFDVDVYLDLHSGLVRGINPKLKLRMREGTTDKALIFDDPELTNFIEDLFSKAAFRGVVDVDLYATPTGYSLLEINPRFSWSYAHSHECGANFIEALLADVSGKRLDRVATARPKWHALAYDSVILNRNRN